MNVKVVKFDPSLLEGFKVQEGQEKLKGQFFNKDYVDFLTEHFHALIKDGKVLGLGGLIPETQDVAQASVLLTDKIGHNFVYIHKAVKNMLDSCAYRRIYMRCHTEFYASLRWAEMLGFEYEGVEKQYVKGADFARFALIKDM